MVEYLAWFVMSLRCYWMLPFYFALKGFVDLVVGREEEVARKRREVEK